MEDPRYKDLELKPIGLDALVVLTTPQIRYSHGYGPAGRTSTGRFKTGRISAGEDAEIIAFPARRTPGSQTL